MSSYKAKLNRNVYKILVGKSERNKPVGIKMQRQEDNIKMEL